MTLSCGRFGVASQLAGNETMREIAVGVGVTIFIAPCIIYLYQPSLIHIWLNRLFFE